MYRMHVVSQCIRTRNVQDVYDTCHFKDKRADRQNKSHRPDFCLPKTCACQTKLFADIPDKTLKNLEKLEKSSIIT